MLGHHLLRCRERLLDLGGIAFLDRENDKPAGRVRFGAAGILAERNRSVVIGAEQRLQVQAFQDGAGRTVCLGNGVRRGKQQLRQDNQCGLR
jgi:hypothetical protein